jgi:hypothetical protein
VEEQRRRYRERREIKKKLIEHGGKRRNSNLKCIEELGGMDFYRRN